MKLNVNESEKDRIRKLHKKYSVITEQDIDVEIEPVVVDPAPPIDGPDDPDLPILQDDGKTKSTSTTTTTQPSGIPCQTIYNAMQAATGVPQYWQSTGVQQMIPAICSKCQSHHASWVSMGSPMPVPQGTDWYHYGAQGQQICLMLIANPQCCNPQQTMWKCSPTGTCTQDPNGQFATQQDCVNSGCGDVYCTDCQGGTMTMGTAGVCPQGYVPNPGTPGSTPPQPVCYECDGNGNCNGPGWSMGPNSYNNQSDCQNGTPTQPACTPPPGWDCVNNSCVQTPGGPYPTQADCQTQTNCGQPTLWECDMSNGCSQTPNGTHQTQAACETACCQDVINNWNWAQGSQQNPCQKFYNMFGPMGSTNPNTLPFNQECIYNYLLNLILNLGGPCVSGNFINLLNNFATGNNGCYGNPASGCQNATDPGCPHQNSICGKMDQFCSASPMTPSKFFKCQYAVQFANTTGCVC